jgi:hypothetical protein
MVSLKKRFNTLKVCELYLDYKNSFLLVIGKLEKIKEGKRIFV